MNNSHTLYDGIELLIYTYTIHSCYLLGNEYLHLRISALDPHT